MTPNQKRFKIFSILILFVALLQVIGGIFLLVGSPLAAGMRISLGGEAVYDGAIAAEVIGVLALVVGLYCLIVGVTGARAANSPRSTGKFNVLAIVMVLASLVQVGLGVTTGQVGWVEVLLAVLGILALVFGSKAHNEALDR